MTIKAGDLVVVVKPTHCCGSADGLGYTFVAGPRSPLAIKKGIRCGLCDQVRPPVDALFYTDKYVIEVNRLKKIPPLAELEREPEEATA